MPPAAAGNGADPASKKAKTLHDEHSVVLVLDYGSQYTQLICRRIRELNIFSMMFPGDASLVRVGLGNAGAGGGDERTHKHTLEHTEHPPPAYRTALCPVPPSTTLCTAPYRTAPRTCCRLVSLTELFQRRCTATLRFCSLPTPLVAP